MYLFLPLIIRKQKDGQHAKRTISRQLTSSLILMCPVLPCPKHNLSRIKFEAALPLLYSKRHGTVAMTLR